MSGGAWCGEPDHLAASRNAARLLHEAFGFWPARLHKHSAYALNRDILAEIEHRWPEAFLQFRGQQFRSPVDLNLTSFLYHHYALMTGRAEIASVRLALVAPQDIRWRNLLRRARDGQTEALCINEGGTLPAGSDWHDGIRRFLEKVFPRAAPWERLLPRTSRAGG